MASFESKVSEIFNEHPKLARKIPVVIKRLFRQSEAEFKRVIANASEEVQQTIFMQLFDILFIDFYFNELNDYFLNWVIKHYPERFTQQELEEMRAEANSHLDFYEVQDVFPGEGSYIKSIITGEEGFLKDISSSHRLIKWDVFLSRCYRFRDKFYATGAFILFKPHHKKFIIDRIRKAMAEYQYDDYSEFAKDRWDIFFTIDREIRERESNKKFYTKYGELQFCEVRFRVNNLNAVLNEIKNRKDFLFVEKKTRRDRRKKKDIVRFQFDWSTAGIEKELAALKTEEGDDGIMISTSIIDESGKPTDIEFIGNFYIDQSLCRLETRSLEIAEFAVGYFERIFGDALTFKRIIKKKLDIERLKDEIGNKDDQETERQSEPDPEIVKEAVEKYYLQMLDEKVPALKNMTPREARKVPEMLPLLLDWLKSLENFNERSKKLNQVTFPIEKIRKELDLDF